MSNPKRKENSPEKGLRSIFHNVPFVNTKLFHIISRDNRGPFVFPTGVVAPLRCAANVPIGNIAASAISGKGLAGINGIQYAPKLGYIYYTATAKKLFMRVRVNPETLEATGRMADDFLHRRERRCCLRDNASGEYARMKRRKSWVSKTLRASVAFRRTGLTHHL
jgi:hypothetical protein